MKDTLRYRNKGGAFVIWNKTGTTGCQINYAVGDWTCEGCGTSLKDVAAVRAERHAEGCSAC